jgi:hypothetical protein
MQAESMCGHKTERGPDAILQLLSTGRKDGATSDDGRGV